VTITLFIIMLAGAVSASLAWSCPSADERRDRTDGAGPPPPPPPDQMSR
jgi:hypothetical protein